jgi:NAD(P)-dependent dehydrogenase (short-subunit alcohol dehydrogenase family)
MLKNSNKVTIVTGSGSGIGRAIALAFAGAGNPVVVNDIVREAGEEVVAEIQRQGGKGAFFLADVSDVTEVKGMFREVQEKFGRVDVLVNNAGVPGPFSLIADMSDENWHKTMSVHLNGTFYCMREAARLMLRQGFGITANAIAPGMVGTPTNLQLKEKGSPFIQTAIEGTPTGRMTTPEEIAELILFLCSSGAGNINGQVICIDGGAEISIGMDQFMLDFLSKRSPTLKDRDPGD